MQSVLGRALLVCVLTLASASLFVTAASAGVTREQILCGDGSPACATTNYGWDRQYAVDVERSLTATGQYVWVGRQNTSFYGELVGNAPVNNPGAAQTAFEGDFYDPASQFESYIKGIAYDPVGNVLFFSDGDDYRVLAFPRGDFSGEPLDRTAPAQSPGPVTGGGASPGSANGSFSSIGGPGQMTFSTFNQRLYVVDYFNARVQIFSYTAGANPTLDYQGQISDGWDTDSVLPLDVAVNPADGHVFVAAGVTNQIQEFLPDGTPDGTIGSGSGASGDEVISVAVDSPDHVLYAVKYQSVDVYSLSTGRLLGTIPGSSFRTSATVGLRDVDIDPIGRDLYAVTDADTGDADNPPVAAYSLDPKPTCALAPALTVKPGESVNIPLNCTDADGAPVKEFHRNLPPALGSITPNSDRTALTYTAGSAGGDDFAEYYVITANGSSKVYSQPVKVVGDPVIRKSANLSLDSGQVFIKLPGSDKFVPLTEDTLIPMGTIIDARDGKAHLTFDNGDGTTQDGVFWDGIFQVSQGSGNHPITTLKLRDDLAKSASASMAETSPAATVAALFSAHAARKRGKKKNGLWGDAHGNYRTSGKGGSASVRGTRWYVADYQYGSLFKVARGVVTINPIRGKNFPLKAGKQFFIFYKR